jgi:hypothetical protein
MAGITTLVLPMDLCWRPVRQALRKPFIVVARDVAFEARFKRWDARIVCEVHVLILDRPPEPFDNDVVQRAAPAIHTDCNPRPFSAVGQGEARQLDALISIEHLGTSVHQGSLQSHQAEGGI